MDEHAPTTIRTASAEDASAVSRMLSAMLGEMEGFGGDAVAAESARQAFFDELVSGRAALPDVRYLIAEDGTGAPVGAANAAIVTLPPAFVPLRSLHVSTVFVVPERRGRGVGRRLVEALLEWGRAGGCTRADLNVLCGNPAKALYERMGFTDQQHRMVLDL